MKARIPAASSLLAACVLTASLFAQSQSPSPPLNLARELAAKIAAAAAPLEQVRLAQVDPTGPDPAAETAVLRDVAVELRARGLSLTTSSDGAASVRVGCSGNLRERVCAAEIVKGDNRDVVVVRGPWAAAGAPPPSRLVTLEVRPVLAQRDPILDLVEIGNRLLVFDTARFELYHRAEAGWTPVQSTGFTLPVAWPRDPRGRLRLAQDGVQAFFPDMVCRCTLEPLKAECTSAPGIPWPLGVPNTGVEPGANYFRSPAVPPFFTAAGFGPETGSGGWLLAGIDGKLRLLDTGFAIRQTLPGIGDDVASVQTPCVPGRAVIAASPAGDGSTAEAIRAFEIAGNSVVPLTTAVQVAGGITAVWETPARTSALVVAYNREMKRYEAFYVGLACVR